MATPNTYKQHDPSETALAALRYKLTHKLSYAEIAKIQGVSKATVFKKIAHLIPTEQTYDYIANRADIFAQIQLRLLSALTDEKLEKASAYQLIGSASLIYDKERLERDLSTTNVSSVIHDIAALKGLE